MVESPLKVLLMAIINYAQMMIRCSLRNDYIINKQLSMVGADAN